MMQGRTRRGQNCQGSTQETDGSPHMYPRLDLNLLCIKLELLNPPASIQCWDYKACITMRVYIILKLNPRVLWMPGEHSILTELKLQNLLYTIYVVTEIPRRAYHTCSLSKAALFGHSKKTAICMTRESPLSNPVSQHLGPRL